MVYGIILGLSHTQMVIEKRREIEPIALVYQVLQMLCQGHARAQELEVLA